MSDETQDVEEGTEADAEEGTKEDSPGDMVGKKYRELYGKVGHNGDNIALVLKEFCLGEGGKIDIAKVQRLCKDNKIEYDKYTHLNVGMQRMVVGNILRGKHRKGETIKVGKDKIDGMVKEEAAEEVAA